MTRAHTSVFNFANTDKLELHSPFHIFPTHRNTSIPSLQRSNTANMAAKNLPPAFNATSQDIEMLLSAQCHIGSKNLQVHMEPYLWKTRPDGINVLHIGKTWYDQYSMS